jgi:hypothetical protein
MFHHHRVAAARYLHAQHAFYEFVHRSVQCDEKNETQFALTARREARYVTSGELPHAPAGKHLRDGDE